LNKHKYLKELDSVCNSEEEMKHALKVLYKTIVLDGDIVVLSFNQLADSNFIVSFLNDEVMKKVLLKLFENKRIKVSKYKYKDESGQEKIMTSAVKYIMDKIEKTLKNYEENPHGEFEFIFSAVNCLNVSDIGMKCSILKVLQNTLEYDDFEYFNDELKRLRASGKLPIMDKDINFLKNYAEFLIRISLSDVEYTQVKDSNIFKFTDCMEIAISTFLDAPDENITLSQKLSELKSRMNNSQRRSEWITEYPAVCTDGILKKETEKVINACYNIAVESSISGVSSIAELAVDRRNDYFFDTYRKISENYGSTHIYSSDIQPDKLLNFEENDKKYWESFIRILENKKIHNKIINSAESADFKPWIKIIDKYRIKRNVKIASLFLFTFVSLIAVNLTIDQIIDWFQLENISVINIVAKGVGFLLAILLGDFAGYVFQIPNLFELLLDKEQRLDMQNCEKIRKREFYNGGN